MGLASDPMSSVPPALTLTFPPTMVSVLPTTLLNVKMPFTVVVEAVAEEISSVTVCPLAINTALQEVGAPHPRSHVLAKLQELDAIDVNDEQKTDSPLNDSNVSGELWLLYSV